MGRRDARALLAPFTLHERTSRLATRARLAAAALALAGAGLVAGRRARGALERLPARRRPAVVLPLLTPLLLRRRLRRVPVRGLGFAYSLRNLGLRLDTSAFALAALAVAVSMLIAVTLLIGSFRRTLETWIGETCARTSTSRASPGRRRRVRPCSTPAWSRAEGFPGVAAADRLTTLPRARSPAASRLIGSTTSARSRGAGRRRPGARGTPAVEWSPAGAGGISISEPLARKEGLDLGDTLALFVAGGIARLRGCRHRYDYSSEGGPAMLLRRPSRGSSARRRRATWPCTWRPAPRPSRPSTR